MAAESARLQIRWIENGGGTSMAAKAAGTWKSFS
jgi:hypothetical protein